MAPPFGFQALYDYLHTPWHKAMVAAAIIAVLAMVLFVLLQSALVRSLTPGAGACHCLDRPKLLESVVMRLTLVCFCGIFIA